VGDDDEAKVNQLYGALYRSSFLPHAISDIDGRCPRFGLGPKDDGKPTPCFYPADRDGRTTYSDFSMWDIYRAQMPLLNIIDPQRVGDMMQSLVTMYEQGGWMPIFPCWNSYTAAMIGDHAASVLADCYVKNGPIFDVKKAYEGVRKNAFESPATFAEYENGMGRRALKSYLRFGYIPLEDSVMEAFHTHEQVSRTLEYAYDDFCAAQLAKAVGNTGDYQELMRRSGNWRNVINPRTGWADGRYRNGKWLNNKDLNSRLSFITEGSVVHYTFYVPHDVKGLMGIKRDSDDISNWYWHGNEPCHQIPYLYAWTREPWKTQKMVHDILTSEYLDVPGGLTGNDDAGQMSAWYVLSALGFYPVCPGTPYYIIGTPSFKRVQVGQLVIEAPEVSDKNIYIQQATWNGEPYTKTYITHDMITQGGTLHFVMGVQPNNAWGTGDDDVPPGVK
jgi:putative alpha-1,2-mannosidase